MNEPKPTKFYNAAKAGIDALTGIPDPLKTEVKKLEKSVKGYYRSRLTDNDKVKIIKSHLEYFFHISGGRRNTTNSKLKNKRDSPKGLLPKGLLPKGLLPKGLLPKGILPKGLLPKGLLPKGKKADSFLIILLKT